MRRGMRYRALVLITVVGVYVGAFLLLPSLSIAQQRGDAPAPPAAGQRGARGANAGRGAPTGPPPRDSQGRADLSGMWMSGGLWGSRRLTRPFTLQITQ